MNQTFLQWLLTHTKTRWWHDSADPTELQVGLQRGAVGVTTNPVLIGAALPRNRERWSRDVERVRELGPEAKAEALAQIVVTDAADQMLPTFEASGGAAGYVCAQVNPARAGDRACMAAMARRLHVWRPNIAVKLPATLAGLDVLEDCVADGITITATVSFTVSQAIAIAERHRAGIARARAKGITPGRCYAVLMIGRLDDYLREIAHDGNARVAESDIRQAGLAVAKQAYAIYQARGYEAELLVAALRGPYHLTELAGAHLVMSIHPTYQGAFVADDLPREVRIDAPVDGDVIERLRQMPDFVRAYDTDGMTPAEFIGYGLTQRTLSQFTEVGWKQVEMFR